MSLGCYSYLGTPGYVSMVGSGELGRRWSGGRVIWVVVLVTARPRSRRDWLKCYPLEKSVSVVFYEQG